MKIDKLNELYIHRHRPIVFNPNGSTPPPARIDNELDEFDTIFSSKEDFMKWYEYTQINLAELDCVMNYCKFFKRLKGNEILVGDIPLNKKIITLPDLQDIYYK